MTVRSIRVRTTTERTFCFGRRQPSQPARAPHLGAFMRAPLNPPPAVKLDWAFNSRALNRPGLENILGNDALGDCVEAACGHMIDIWHADAGTGQSVTADQTVAFYSASSGYVPGDPNTDNGSEWPTVLNYWVANGFVPGAKKPAGFVAVDPANRSQLMSAVWLFGNLLFGGELLTDWVAGMQTMRSGFTWAPGSKPDPQAGHAFLGYGYNHNGVFIDTWGMFGTLTWAAIAEFSAAANNGEVYSVLSAEWIDQASQLAPNGLDIAALENALKEQFAQP